MGGLTTGLVAVDDARIKAAAYVAVPASFPLATLISGTPERTGLPAAGAVPAGPGGHRDDAVRSRRDPDRFPGLPAAGLAHRGPQRRDWSFADDCAIAKDFSNGCGTGTRLADAATQFTFLDNETARGIAKRYIGAFFLSQLAGASAAPLGDAVPPASVIASAHTTK